MRARLEIGEEGESKRARETVRGGKVEARLGVVMGERARGRKTAGGK